MVLPDNPGKTEYGEGAEEIRRKITANDSCFACRRTACLRRIPSHAHRLFAIENAQGDMLLAKQASVRRASA